MGRNKLTDEQKAINKQNRKWDKELQEMEDGNFWDKDSGPYARNKILQKEMTVRWDKRGDIVVPKCCP